MSYFIRLIDYSIVDFFVQQAEGFRYCRDQFLKHAPYLLCDGKLHSFFADFPEEATYSLVVAEPSGHRKDVILYAAQCCSGNLGSEACALAFAEAKIGLAILEGDFKRPASGVNLPCLAKIKFPISGKQTVPFSVLCTAYKKDPDRDSSENSIIYDIVALELAAVFLLFEFPAEFDKSRSGKFPIPGLVLCLAVFADLDHAEPMAFDMAAVDKADNIFVGEPAVGQYIAELYPFPDSSSYHLFGQFEFGHIVCIFALTQNLTIMLRLVAAPKFFGAHAIISLLSFLSDYIKVKKDLRHSVSNRHTETFEAEYCFMGKMGMYPAYFLNGTTGLLMVGVVKNQTYVLRLIVGAYENAAPKLHRYVPQCLAPVYAWILHKSVEDILASLDKCLKRTVFMTTPCVLYAEAGEKCQNMKHGHQWIDAVPLASNGKRVALGHPNLGKNRTYVLHGSCHIRILENRFDIREEWCNFVYRHGPELVFWWYLKLLISCQLGKKPCRFFMSSSLESYTCET